jgi:hypothetical protein
MRFYSKTLCILKPLLFDDDDIHFLEEIDFICVEIEKDSENTTTLCKKAKDILGRDFPKKDVACDTHASGRTDYGLEKDDRRRDLFFEILSYEYLNKTGYSSIKFLPDPKGWPDFKANKNGKVLFAESKCIHRPKTERDHLMLAQIDTEGIPEASANDVDSSSCMIKKVRKKFRCDLKNAKSKFEKVQTEKQNRIILFSFEWSIGAVIRQQNSIDFFSDDFLSKCKQEFDIGEIIQVQHEVL